MKNTIAFVFAALVALTSLTAAPAFARHGADDPKSHDKNDDHGRHGPNHDKNDDHGRHGPNHK
ncbi:MAG: hypothetical protein JWM58_2914 [Rhizobium sp.]|nr:hypothetical protein [Rhizobium sp.]